MRSMGPMRFDLGAIKRMLQKETFEGKLQTVLDEYPANNDVKKNIFETSIHVEELNQGTYFNSGMCVFLFFSFLIFSKGPPIPSLEKYFFDEVLNVTGKTSYLPEVDEIVKDVITENDSLVLFCASNVSHISVSDEILFQNFNFFQVNLQSCTKS